MPIKVPAEKKGKKTRRAKPSGGMASSTAITTYTIDPNVERWHALSDLVRAFGRLSRSDQTKAMRILTMLREKD